MVARDIIKGYKGAEKGAREGSISKKECKQEEHYRWDTMVLMAARHIIERKKETCFDGSIRTLYVVTLDNILHNKNNIIKKQ